MSEIDASTVRSLQVLAAAVPSLAELFATDSNRSDWLTVDACGVHADFSRQHVSKDLFEALMKAVSLVDVSAKFAAMAAGDIVNSTEKRAVGHMALRAPADSSELARLAAPELQRARALAHSIRDGALVGSTGRSFSTVVNIGIGGSDL